jgi:hypothetical protein
MKNRWSWNQHTTTQKVSAVLYLVIVIIAVLIPRYATAPWAQPRNIFFKWLHHFIYLSGPLEVLGNYFLLAPMVFVLKFYFPKLKLSSRVLIGCGTSALIELVQLVIPGRVSAWQDFVSNSIGVCVVGVASKVYDVRSNKVI